MLKFPNATLEFNGARLCQQVRAAQCLFPHHHRLRHPAQPGRDAGQARLSGRRPKARSAHLVDNAKAGRSRTFCFGPYYLGAIVLSAPRCRRRGFCHHRRIELAQGADLAWTAAPAASGILAHHGVAANAAPGKAVKLQVRADALQMVHQGGAVLHLEHHGLAVGGLAGHDIAAVDADLFAAKAGRLRASPDRPAPKRSQVFFMSTSVMPFAWPAIICLLRARLQ